MTLDEFAILAKAMKAVYADPKFLADDDAMTVWYEMLKDISYDKASMALKRHIQSNRFMPTVADIRQQVSAMEGGGAEMSALEAWAVVYRAVCNSGYDSVKEFAMLPPLCKEAVGRPENLREWALMDIETVQSVGQSHFIRAYNAAAERRRREARISPPLRTMIGGAGREMIEG